MAQCISQIRIKSGDGYEDVPCGRCGFCLQNRRKEWSFRLQKENRYHDSSYFVTLTYSDENLVLGDNSNGVPFAVLHKPDYQLFMKRLRFQQSKISETKIKYYAVGEYGTKTNRPHYHALLFSLEPQLVDRLDDIWGQGHSHVGPVNADTIDYITKYVVNKYDHSHYVVPPFSCISNGIGLKHFEDNRRVYEKAKTVINQRGFKQRVPRYYRDKIGKNRYIKKIESAQAGAEFEEKRSQEVDRLGRTHTDAEAYLFERDVANNNRILKKVKEGGKF